MLTSAFVDSVDDVVKEEDKKSSVCLREHPCNLSGYLDLDFIFESFHHQYISLSTFYDSSNGLVLGSI